MSKHKAHHAKHKHPGSSAGEPVVRGMVKQRAALATYLAAILAVFALIAALTVLAWLLFR